MDSCRPTFDRAVYALDRSPDGLLLVGGEFESVNGEVRRGLVALDPVTCQAAESFAGAVDRPYSENRAIVRDMKVVGDDLYLAGNFSHLLGPDAQRVRVYKAGRMDSRTGRADPAFAPAVTGSGVWGMALDPERGRVHLTGYFSGVNGTASSGNFHTVDTATGASVSGLAARPRNYPRSQPEVYDVAMGDDRVFVAGEQHVVQVLDADSHEMTAFSHTGAVPCAGSTFLYCGSFAGGAYQVAERIGDVVFAGCHCTYATRNGNLSHYNSVTGQRTPNKLTMAYDAATGRLLEDFRPDLDGSKDGSWAVASDTNGCLYLGGDYKVGGVAAGRSRWIGGFAKLCPRGWTPPMRDTIAPSVPTGLEVAAVGDDAVQLELGRGHRQRRGHRLPGLSGRDHGRRGDRDQLHRVRADAGQQVPLRGRCPGRRGEPQRGERGGRPHPRAGSGRQPGSHRADRPDGHRRCRHRRRPDLVASSDNVGVVSYLIYRDGAYVGWSRTPGYTDAGAGPGPVEYAVRATDAIGNRSLKSDPVPYSAAAVDVEPPSVPTGLAASDVDGGSVRLTWTASSDDVGVQSYLVYRGGAYIGWSDSPGFTDGTAPVGDPAGYQLRAVDRAGNRSAKSPRLRASPLGEPDDGPGEGGMGPIARWPSAGVRGWRSRGAGSWSIDSGGDRLGGSGPPRRPRRGPDQPDLPGPVKASAGVDELLAATSGQARPGTEDLLASIDLLGLPGLLARRAEAARLVEDEGVIYGVPVGDGPLADDVATVGRTGAPSAPAGTWPGHRRGAGPSTRSRWCWTRSRGSSCRPG